MKQFFKIFFTAKGEVNYLYFSFFLLVILFLTFLHYQGQRLSGIPLFFLFYAIAQSILEVFIFVLITSVIKKWGPSWLYHLFIGSSFLLLLFHLTDFILVRLMDGSGTYVFKFFLGSGIAHIIAGLEALNMSWTMAGAIIASILSVPILGFSLYHLTHRFAHRKPLRLSLNQIGLGIGVVGTSLLLLDIAAHPFINRPIHSQFKKTLPFGATFLPPHTKYLALSHSLAQVRDEIQTHKQLPSLSLEKKPNIYFFIIETFRKDFLYAAPQLSAFGEENLQFESSFSNAISTQLSWFAIFHSDLPFYWASMRDSWKRGSIPLHYFKKLGYRINVYSSADLRFFQMDKLLFGHTQELIDSLHTFDRNLPPCDRDALALEALAKNTTPQGELHIIFLDSPHSEYSFPNDFPLKYLPISKEIDYLTIRPNSPGLELIKNRYRNSIHYVDFLIGNFFDHLKQKGLYNDAIISITGDHGEEFFEEGALFHGTHLNHYQTSVPILMKFPSPQWIPATHEATHIDLFPSILHYLTNQADFASLFDGRSVFSPNRNPFRVAVLQNGTAPPREFTIHNIDLALHGKFVRPQKLEIVDLEGTFSPDLLSPLLTKE